MCYLSVKRSDERASYTVFFTSENNDTANQSIDTSFFTSEKSGMTNQLASLARRDYFYLYAFWRVNLSMYIINSDIQKPRWMYLSGFLGRKRVFVKRCVMNTEDRCFWTRCLLKQILRFTDVIESIHERAVFPGYIISLLFLTWH